MVRVLRIDLLAAALALAALGACAATQGGSLPDAERHIAEAEADLSAGNPEGCRARLDGLGVEAFPRRLRDRVELALANAHFALDRSWDAFEICEKFPDRYPHSELRSAIVELDWLIGRRLAESGRGFWFFWSDRRAARTVLEHLITRHPDTPRLADALRLLGDMAYEDELYPLAQERFRDLMRRRPESEWVVYARFRFAMSIYAGLKGRDYDLDQMEHATRELRDFLRANPENPEFIDTAKAAVAQLLAWQCERHLDIAAFYQRINNLPGRRHHLTRAASEEFATAPAHARATADLRALDAAAEGRG